MLQFHFFGNNKHSSPSVDEPCYLLLAKGINIVEDKPSTDGLCGCQKPLFNIKKKFYFVYLFPSLEIPVCVF